MKKRISSLMLTVLLIVSLLSTWSVPALAAKKTVSPGAYLILSALNGNKAVDVNGGSASNGAKIQLWDKNMSGAQGFYLEYNNGYYVIKNVGSGKVLDVQGNRAGNGVAVTQWEPHGDRNQLWELISAGKGYYYIKSAMGNYYLDVWKSQTANGTPLIIWQAQKSANQKFIFQPVNVSFNPTKRTYKKTGSTSNGFAEVNLHRSNTKGKLTITIKDVWGRKSSAKVHVVLRDTAGRWIREFDTTSGATLTLGTDYMTYRVYISPCQEKGGIIATGNNFINNGKWASWEMQCNASNCYIR